MIKQAGSTPLLGQLEGKCLLHSSSGDPGDNPDQAAQKSGLPNANSGPAVQPAKLSTKALPLNSNNNPPI